MRILALDTSVSSFNIAFYDGKKIYEKQVTNIKNHSTTLLPLIDEFINQYNISLDKIEYYAITLGPGSFTGLRIGLATLKGINYAYDKSIIPLNTLDAYTYDDSINTKYICSMIMMNKKDIYANIYIRNNNKYIKINDIIINDIDKLIKVLPKDDITIVGNATEVYKNNLENSDICYIKGSVYLSPVCLINYSLDNLNEEIKLYNNNNVSLNYYKGSQGNTDEIVRVATLEDIDNIMMIENSMFNDPYTEKQIISEISNDNTLFYVYEINTEVVAYIIIRNQIDVFELFKIAVKKEYQRNNIGTKMMQYLSELMKNIDKEKMLFLEVRQSNDKAIKFYEKLNFVKKDIRKNYYESPAEDAYIMILMN